MIQLKWPLLTLAVLAPAALVGCGGSSGNVIKPNSPTPTPLPGTITPTPTTPANGADSNVSTTNFIGLLSSGTALVFFRGDAPANGVTRVVTGLPGGVRLRGIDARVAPMTASTSTGSNGTRALYALGSNDQLYTLDTSGTDTVAATAVGSPATFAGFTPRDGAYGFDFNPQADRLRVVSGTENERINPNTGAAVDGDSDASGTNPDGTLRYDASDRNAGKTPNLTAAAYTNNSVGTQSTLNYAIDSDSGALVTQGRASSAGVSAVSPNTGVLYTVGLLGSDFSGDAGLEIFGTANRAVAVDARSFYSIDLTSGAATKIGDINAPSDVTDITIAL